MKPLSAAAFDTAFPAADTANPLPRQMVLGVPLVDATTQDTVDALLNGTARRVYFLNAHCANERARNPAYAAALSRADAVLPDGVGIDIAARLRGHHLRENLNGTDFVPELLRAAARQGLSVFLFGARPGTAEKAARTLCHAVPGLRIAGTRDGYEGALNTRAAVDQINRSGADILLVAMGVPAQELWIDAHVSDLSPRLVLGVGALFDFLAGHVSRAPVAVRRMRMEWIWRLAQEPRRLARRYLVGNATFLMRAATDAAQMAGRQAMMKRGMDLLASGMLLTLLAPLFFLLAVMIRLDSKGPAFFRQTRVGRDGVPFSMYKFRTMHMDAEARLASLSSASDRAGVCFKSRHDPRVTRIGRILRRTSIDELPQILNVLLGQMSLVGPRPALPREVAAYPVHALERLKTRPGITGLWQVSGRADISFDKMVDMDLAYVRSRSLWLDLLLLSMTARAVLSGRGAY